MSGSGGGASGGPPAAMERRSPGAGARRMAGVLAMALLLLAGLIVALGTGVPPAAAERTQASSRQAHRLRGTTASFGVPACAAFWPVGSSAQMGTSTISTPPCSTPITQTSPTAGATTAAGSSRFTDQLATTGQHGAVSFVTTSTPACGVAVSPAGVVTAIGRLHVGSCTVSGTDSDTARGRGTWTYTLAIVSVSIIQREPKTGRTTTHSASFTDHLTTAGRFGQISFVTMSTGCGVMVSPAGAITTTGRLSAGQCTVSGTDSDIDGDTGTWTYTLTVRQARR